MTILETPQIRSVLANNPHMDILGFDFHDTAKVDALDWSGTNRQAALPRLMAAQRVLRLNDSPEVASAVLNAGFDSANSIAAMPRSTFIATVAPALGENGTATAATLYDRASTVRSKTLHLVAAIHASARSAHLRTMRASPLSDDVLSYFQDLPSYESMFGSLDYCSCDECQSVLGPAAYLVDLLRIIGERVTTPNSTTIPAGLALLDRRPDIAEIPLTCANTNGVVPYLQLVNDILLRHAGPTPLPTAATAFFPYNLPFNQPLAWITGLMGLKSWTLARLRRVLSAGGASSWIAPESLGLSVEQATNLAPCAVGDLPARLTANFGVTVTTSSLGGLNQVATFSAQTGIAPQDLTTILRQNLGAQELMNLDGMSWALTGGEGTLALTQENANITGTFGTSQAGTLHASLNGNGIGGSFTMTADPHNGNQPSTGFVSATIDWSSGALTGTRTIITTAQPVTVPWSGSISQGTMTAGTISHQLFFNTALPARAFLRIETDTSDPDNPIDHIVGLDLPSLDRLNRLIRMARQLGWSETDLAWMVVSLGIGDFDSTGVTVLAQAARLGSLGLGAAELAALWFDIKTIGQGNGTVSQAPFDTIFNSPDRIATGNGGKAYRPVGGDGAFVNPLYTDAALPWIVHPQNGDLAATAKKLGVNADDALRANIIVSCIPIGGDDLVALADALFDTSTFLPLTVATLSALYRHAILVQALKLRVVDYLTLLPLLGLTQPGTSRVVTRLTPAQVQRLSDFAAAAGALNVTVADLGWICAGIPSSQVPAGYDDTSLAAFRTSLAPAMAPTLLTAAAVQSPDMTAQQAQQCWQALMDQGFLDNMGAVLDKIASATPDLSAVVPPPTPAQASFVTATAVQARQAQLRKLISQLATFLGAQEQDMAAIADGLCGLLGQSDPADLFLLTQVCSTDATKVLDDTGMLDLGKAAPILATAGVVLPTGALVRQQSSRAWAITDAAGQNVCAYAHRSPAGATDTVGFLLPATAWPPSGGPAVPTAIATLVQLLARYLRLQSLLTLSAADLAGLFLYPAAFTGASLSNNAPTPDGVLVLGHSKALARTFNDQQGRLTAYLIAANIPGAEPSQLAQTLAQLTGWDLNGLNAALDQLCPGGVCNSAPLLDQLSQVFTATSELGSTVQALFALLDTVTQPATAWSTYQQTADTLTQSVKGQFPEDVWTSQYRALTGSILAASRDVLVPMTIRQLAPTVPLASARMLSEFLLVDVETSGCADISPIKLALNSCQLYLQRCRLNLEPGVVVTTDDIPTNWWEWIMEYRLWQANREIFIYPENYLDPAVRHNKTQLFRDLENSLSQGEATTASVQAAFTKYLDGFATLARLVYVAGYHTITHDPDLGPQDTLYLFARTPTEPYTYYYITRQPGEVWSEWTKIDVTINTDVITPVYVFSRLFLFWVELSTVAEQQSDQSKSTITTANIRYSFIDFSGNWVQPQSLVSDLVVNVQSPATKYGAFSAGLFTPTQPYFGRVQAIVSETSGYGDLGPLSPTAAEIEQKLTIVYGPTVTVTGTPPTSTQPTAPGTAGAAFAATLSAARQTWSDMVTAGQTGVLPIYPAITLDGSLNVNFLLNEDEVVLPLATPFSATSPCPPVLAWDAVTTKLAAFDTSVAPYQDYVEGMGLTKVVLSQPSKANAASFVTPSIIDSTLSQQIFTYLQGPSFGAIAADGTVQPIAVMLSVGMLMALQITDVQARVVKSRLAQMYYGSLVLFGQTARKGIGVTPVANQPGYAIVNVPGEAFLISTPTASLPMLDTALRLERPYAVINANTFVCDYFDQTMSQTILTSLQKSGGFVSSTGVVNLVSAAQTPVNLYMIILQFDEMQASLVKDILLRQGPTGLLYTAAGQPDDILYSLPYQVDRLTTGAIDELSRTLFNGGIDALLSLSSQDRPSRIRLPFSRLQPNAAFIKKGPSVPYGNQVDFGGAYKLYYWELFFYAPTLVAQALRNNQQFADSQRWLQYVFNPTTPPHPVTAADLVTPNVGQAQAQTIYNTLVAAKLIVDGAVATAVTTMSVSDFATACGLDPSKPDDMTAAEQVQNALVNLYLVTPSSQFWQFLPLRNNTIESLRQDFQDPAAIAVYDNDPFDPHAIAQLRIGAYQKSTVMTYIDNLITWGDQMFSLYTWESITTATMLYMYAYDLLGPKPVDVGPCSQQFPVDFNDIKLRYANDPSGIPQFLIDMEHFVQDGPVVRPNRPGHPYNDLGTYFCVPENQQFVAYWDTVNDRLYKIRHCLNIQGVAQPLALWEPPINPMALVQAAAAGGAIDAAAYLQPNIPAYRFQVMIVRAKELTAMVAQFGGALLAALEKKDAEALQLMRASQENVLLDMTTMVRQKAIEDLQDQIAAQTEALNNATYRRDYYQGLLNQGLNVFEITNLTLMNAALIPQALSLGIHGISIAAYLAPNIFGLADGGMQFGEAVNAGAAITDGTAQMLNQSAGLVSTMNEYVRRAEDWTFQLNNAKSDITRLTSEIASAQARLAASQQELAIHLKTVEQGKAVEQVLRTHFCNADLYQWMISRLSGLYYQAYQLALSTAMAAQAAYRFETDRDDSFISFNYWDNLHKGLLAGEALDLSVRQMETAFDSFTPRRLEIEKTLSLRRLFPQEFQKFKWGPDGTGGQGRGVLNFNLSQALFDFDFPGQYCRKIHSVTVSIPAVAGPYQNVHATLTQTANYVDLQGGVDVVKWLVDRTVAGTVDTPQPAATALRQNWVPNQQVVLSRGTDDSGLFVVDGNDPRYLPFEGTGAVSSWTLSLPVDTNRINFDSITDVLLTVRYTAKDGGQTFAQAVRGLYRNAPAPYTWIEGKTMELALCMPAAWQGLMTQPTDPTAHRRISFPITDDAMLVNLSAVKVLKVVVQMELATATKTATGKDFLTIQFGTQAQPVAIQVTNNVGSPTLPSPPPDWHDATWTLDFDPAHCPSGLFDPNDPARLINLSVSVYYAASAFG